MPKFVAFLRAINVGRHLVKMDHLRSLFEQLGFANVETFIASGNVIFDTKATNTKTLEGKIEKHLEKSLGYEVKTFLRSIDELVEIAQHQPFDEKEVTAEGNTLYIAFVSDRPSPSTIKKFESLSSAIDVFRIYQREVFWLYSRAHGDSKYYGALLEKNLGTKATLRNSNTVKRLAAKYGKGSD